MELVSCQPPDDFLLPGVLSFNALMGLSCYRYLTTKKRKLRRFNALMGLSCYVTRPTRSALDILFQCPHGLELLPVAGTLLIPMLMFQCPHGLELLRRRVSARCCQTVSALRFNVLMGLSCYCKNVQYFKFFMILFMHPCYL